MVELALEVEFGVEYASTFAFAFDLVVVFVDFAFSRLKFVDRIVTVEISKLEMANLNLSSETFFEDIWSYFYILCSKQCNILRNSPF